MDHRRKLADLKGAYEGIGEAFDLDFSDAYTHIHDELFRVFDLYYEKFGSKSQSRTTASTTQQG